MIALALAHGAGDRPPEAPPPATTPGATARRGSAALREVAAAAPDIVRLDLNMPGLDGVGALSAIRTLTPRTIVIMVSGTTNSEVAKRALAYGAFDYVAKPIDITYLAQSIVH